MDETDDRKNGQEDSAGRKGEIRFAFHGRTALVTGGRQGIGRRIAERLREAGAHVHVFDQNIPVGEVFPEGMTFHQVDVTDAAAVAEAVAALDPKPELLVNNAGITRDRTLKKMTDAEWGAVLSVNLTGAFHLIRALAPIMMDKGYGRIVNITSINGLRGKFGQANYAAAKAGLIGLTKSAAREFGRKGVTVNAVAPGMVMTDMVRQMPPEMIEKGKAETVTGRICTTDDIADGVLFLLSENAGGITGEVLRIDAGQYI